LKKGKTEQAGQRPDQANGQQAAAQIDCVGACAGRRVRASFRRETQMNLNPRPRMTFLFSVLVCVLFPLIVQADDQTPTLTKDQIKQFLQTADVIKSKQSSKGVTHPWRLTMSDGKITHDASFQPIDEHKSAMKLESGATEIGFVDSWKYNIAGYEIADLIGLGDMVPVYVERKWNGKVGSLSWWLPVMMDDAERMEKKIEPPNSEAWNKQIYRVRVFDELIYDTDTNLTNVLIGKDWTVWRIDFGRAFRRSKDLHRPNDLVKCDRQLLEKLKALKTQDVSARTKGYLNKEDVEALMTRRDKIVARFQQLAAQQGESKVFY